MIWLGIMFMCVIMFIVGMVLKVKFDYHNYEGFTITAIVVFIVATVLLTLITTIEYSGQLSDFENIIKYENVEKIYEDKAISLTNQFAKYLMLYPEYEKEIYDKISPDDIGVYLVKYPELKASTTIIALVDKINRLQTDIYDTKIKLEGIKASIRFRTVNPWCANFLIPSVRG